MSKLNRMYKALEENRQAIREGKRKSYYIKNNEYLSILIAKEENA